MVIEQIYSSRWISRKARYAFLMGISYSIIGIASALFLFPQNPGFPSIAFTSLLLLPSLNRLLLQEENQAAKKKKSNILGIFRDHSDIFRVYLFLFLGILMSYSLFSAAWPSISTGSIFQEQVNAVRWAAGMVYNNSAFYSLFLNSLKVLVFCMLASFVYGSGAIFIITWNASVWGTIFGMIAREGAIASGSSPAAYLALTFLTVLPHMILKASSYFMAAISGGIVSKAVLRERSFSRQFKQIIQDGLIVFIIAILVLALAAYLETYLYDYLVMILEVS